MTRRTLLFAGAISLILISTAAGQQRKLLYDQLLRPQGEEYHHTVIGLCEDYPEESTTPAIIRGDMELLKRSGIKLLRISFGWDGIETSKGKYNWLFWDEYVRTAVDEYGITLIPYICYTPLWNSTGDTSNCWNHTPVDYQAFGDFVTALVTRYKDRIKTWELWNEPDIKEYWSGTAEDLARLTKIGAQAVRAADPTAKVVLAGLAHRVEFTKALFRDYGISPYVDIVNCHSYFETWSGDPLEQVTDYVNAIADVIARYGDGQSMWMAEVGYSTVRRAHGVISDSYTATYEYEHTPAFQAVAMWRTLTLLLATQKIAAVAWYELKDLPPMDKVIGDDNNRHLGVALVDYTPKPAERALSFFNGFFARKVKCIDNETEISRTVGSESVVHAFRMDDGSVTLVSWLRTVSKGKAVRDADGTGKDLRQESITVSLPMKHMSSAAVYDEVGTERPATNVSMKNGQLTVRGLTLHGGTISILRINP
jgi:polysaccharide biosynthesis protein PslG